MVKVKEEKPLFQWCIVENRVQEVLAIDKDLTIEELTFRVGITFRTMATRIPPTLAALGVTSLREPSTTLEASGMLSGARSAIARDAREICKELSLDIRHMRVQRLRLEYKGSVVSFTRTTKKMDIGDGKTEQIKVLGVVVTDGTKNAIETIMKKLNANKVHCKYSVQTIKSVICSK